MSEYGQRKSIDRPLQIQRRLYPTFHIAYSTIISLFGDNCLTNDRTCKHINQSKNAHYTLRFYISIHIGTSSECSRINSLKYVPSLILLLFSFSPHSTCVRAFISLYFHLKMTTNVILYHPSICT